MRCLKDFSFSFLELSKLNKTKEQLASMVDKWAYFFKNAGQTEAEGLELTIGNDNVIDRAYAEPDCCKWSAEQLMAYDDMTDKISVEKECLKHARLVGLEEGHKKGWEEEKIAIAKKLILEGLSSEVVARATNLSSEIIAQLRSSY